MSAFKFFEVKAMLRGAGRILLLCLLPLALLMITASAHCEERPLICIDAGHQASPDHSLERIAPWSQKKKQKVSRGAKGAVSGVPEYKLNLENAFALKKALEARGFRVVMTREAHEVSISNKERAELANKAGAELSVRLHADWSPDPEKRGLTVLIPGAEMPIYADSLACARLLNEAFEKAGIPTLKISERKDLTGFNWSKVPSVLIEAGFLSNVEDERLLLTAEYQQRLAEAAASGIEEYFAARGKKKAEE